MGGEEHRLRNTPKRRVTGQGIPALLSAYPSINSTLLQRMLAKLLFDVRTSS